MASTKARTAIESALTLTAGAGDDTGTWVDLSDGYGATLSIQVTNGATGPTVPAQVQIQVANNYNAGSPTLIVAFGEPLIAKTGNAAVSEWHIEIPIGTEALRLVSGSNTGQNVTLDADISEITAI